jgi:antitoxin CptB
MTDSPADPDADAALETRRRRLAIRCWRRGTREMDLILGRYADAALGGMGAAELDALEALMGENDWDLYYWVTGARPAPAGHAALVERIATFHAMR